MHILVYIHCCFYLGLTPSNAERCFGRLGSAAVVHLEGRLTDHPSSVVFLRFLPPF